MLSQVAGSSGESGFISAALGIIRGETPARSPSVRILHALRDGRIVGLVTTSVLYEIAETLQAPRLGLPIEFAIDFVDVVATLSEFVPIRGLDMGCRDEDDDRLVETAINGRAFSLVTATKISSRARRSEVNSRSAPARL